MQNPLHSFKVSSTIYRFTTFVSKDKSCIPQDTFTEIFNRVDDYCYK